MVLFFLLLFSSISNECSTQVNGMYLYESFLADDCYDKNTNCLVVVSSHTCPAY